jgi:membrane-associated protein
MDTQSLLESFGYLLIFISVFIECGVPLGLILPLPGFSLLFTAGVFAATGGMNIYGIIVVGSIAAILGYFAGYYTGFKYGRTLFYEKSTKKYFTREQGQGVEKFMRRYGYLTLVIGRFLPIMHTLAPILSGISKTRILPFTIVNIIGGIMWVLVASFSGYWIGQSVPYAQYIAIPFIVITIIFVNSRYGKRTLDRLTQKIESL